MKKYLPYFSGIVMAVIFGFSFLFTKNALDTLGTFQLLFLRFIAASASMTLLIAAGIMRVGYKEKGLKPLFKVAIWEPVLYFILETMALKYTTSSEAGVMMAFIPVLVTILAAFLLKEKPGKIQIVFIVISVVGVLSIVLFGEGGGINGQFLGIILLFGAVTSSALFNIFSRRASAIYTPFEITYFMMCLGVIIFGGIYFIEGMIKGNINLFSNLNFENITAILYLGVLSSVVAFLLANYNLSKLPASQSSVFANLTTVVSVIAGITFRNEPFELYKIAGALMIIAGVWGTNYFAVNQNNTIEAAGENIH